MQNWFNVNIPNALSFFRLLLAIPLVYAILNSDSALAVITLVLAGFTDWADGFIARRFNLQTQLGAWLDPLADKVILNATFLALAAMGLVPYWVVIPLLLRDIVITLGAFLYFRMQQKMEGQANVLGKLSTLVQFAVVLWCVFFPELPIDVSVFIGMIIVTIGSGALYIGLWGPGAFKPLYQAEISNQLKVVPNVDVQFKSDPNKEARSQEAKSQEAATEIGCKTMVHDET